MGRYRITTQGKRKRRRRIFWFVVFPMLLIAGITASYGTYLYKKMEVTMGASFFELDGRDGKSNLRDKNVDPHIDNVSILFIGIDDSDDRDYGDSNRALSDALMLATLNEKEKSVKLLSIPRDSYVYVNDVGRHTKINHAHAHGGPASTVETVEEMLEVPVDYYVRMDFKAFMEVVDALGGVKVDVPYALSEMNSKDKHNAIKLKPGLQTLNGEEALALARTRKLDNDIERGKRQQEIMKAIADKATSGASIPKYGKVIEAIGDSLQTNMTFAEMKALIDYAIASDFQIDTMTLAGEDSYINSTYYYQLDELELAEQKTTLQTHLGVSNNTDLNEIANPTTE